MAKSEPDKIKVLLVDDDPLIIRMYEHKLTQEGYEVFLAFDGEKGYVMAKENKPDAILLDLMMPRLNGIETLKLLKKDADTKKIPVVILTNIGDDKAYMKAVDDLGAKDYLVKAQVSLKELAEKVAHLTGKK